MSLNKEKQIVYLRHGNTPALNKNQKLVIYGNQKHHTYVICVYYRNIYLWSIMSGSSYQLDRHWRFYRMDIL